VLDPVQVGEQQGGPQSELRIAGAPPLPRHPDARRINPGSLTDPDAEHVDATQPVPLPTLGAEPVPNEATAAINRVADAVETAVQDLVASKAVVVRRHDLWVEVELRTDILFPSGAAQLAPGATGVIEKLADALAAFPNAIRVEGYTDNRPINTLQYPSNWELSAARAATVVEVLARHGVDPTRLSVLGLGEFRPIASNATPEGRNANRRVLLVIQSPTDPAADATAATPAAPTTAATGTPSGVATDPGQAPGADPQGGATPVGVTGLARVVTAPSAVRAPTPVPASGLAPLAARAPVPSTPVPAAAVITGHPALPASAALTAALPEEQH
jgi:chemotaxis protein MotB